MGEENGIIEIIDTALKDPRTPKWGRALLLVQRDDHVRLREHLNQHARHQMLADYVTRVLAAALAMALLAWLLSGGLSVLTTWLR